MRSGFQDSQTQKETFDAEAKRYKVRSSSGSHKWQGGYVVYGDK